MSENSAEAGRTYPVPYGLKVSVSILRNEDTDTAQVRVHAPMYMRKEWDMPFSYTASQFSDAQILRDHNFTTRMAQAFPD